MADEKKTLKEVEKLLKAKDKSLETTKKELDVLKEMDETYRSIAGTYGAGGYLKSLENQKRTLESLAVIQEAEREAQKELNRIADRGEAGEELAEIEEAALELRTMSLDATEAELSAMKGITDQLRIQLKLRRDKKKENKEDEKREKSYEKHLSIAEGNWDRVAKTTGLFSTNLTGITRKIGKWKEDGEQIAATWDTFRDRFNFANLAASLSEAIITSTAQLVKAADTAVTAFAATTGAGSAYNDVIVGIQRSANLYGVTMDEAGASTAELFMNTTNFVNMSPRLQRAFGEQAALLSKIGLSAKESATMFNTLNLGLHMTEEAAVQATAEIATMGVELGINASQMASDFEQAMGTLMIYGPRAKDMFTDLAAASRASGVSVDKLLGLAKKFDTFKDSAKTVAGLNALLGTQLSTTQMVMMTEEDRVEHVIKTIQAQGTAFKDMDRWYKKSLASQLDMTGAEAEKVLGMDLGQYEMYRKKMADTAAAQERIKEAVNDALPLAEQFVILFKELGEEVLPILETLRDWMKWTRNAWGGLNEGTKKAIKGFILLAGAVSALLLVIVPAGKAMVGFYSAVAAGTLFGSGTAVVGTGASVGMGAMMIATAKGVGFLTLALLGLTVALGGVMVLWSMFSAVADWFSGLGEGASEAAQIAADMADLEASTTPKAAAVLENLALLKTGQAAQALTGQAIAATVNNIHSSVEAILPNQLVLVIDDSSRTTLNAYIDARAAGVASGRITSPIQSGRR